MGVGEGEDTTLVWNEHMKRVLCQIVTALTLLCGFPALAQPIFGVVSAVSDDGQITLDATEEFYLWAMVPTDPEKFRTALLGRHVYCTEVMGSMDCMMFPRNELIATFPIMALIWLPEMGVATYSCDYSYSIQTEGAAFGFAPGTYACEAGKPVFPPHSIGQMRVKDFEAYLAKRQEALKP